MVDLNLINYNRTWIPVQTVISFVSGSVIKSVLMVCHYHWQICMDNFWMGTISLSNLPHFHAVFRKFRPNNALVVQSVNLSNCLLLQNRSFPLGLLPHSVSLQVYPCELEKVPEFSECSEWVETYDLYKGKSVDDDEPDSHRLSAKFKGNNLRKVTLTNCLYLL